MPPPVCQSIIVCEQVIEDKRTNNKSFVSVFNQLCASSVPFRRDRMVIVASLTECMGTQKFVLEITKDTEDGEAVVMQLEGGFRSKDPLATLDFVFELMGIPFESFGKYTVRLKSLPEETILGQRHFMVAQIPTEGRES